MRELPPYRRARSILGHSYGHPTSGTTPFLAVGTNRVSVVDAGIEIIHSTDSNITISVLVPDDDAGKAEQAVHDFFALGHETAAR